MSSSSSSSSTCEGTQAIESEVIDAVLQGNPIGRANYTLDKVYSLLRNIAPEYMKVEKYVLYVCV